MTGTGTVGGRGVGIAIASGMLKGVFGHGVLSAFEEHGLRADVYGTASSSVLSGGLAASGRAREVGVRYWRQAAAGAAEKGMSQVVLDSIAEFGPGLCEGLFRSDAPDFLLATSKVVGEGAAVITQGSGARQLGRDLLRNVLNGDRGWVERNLATTVFANRPGTAGATALLTPENFNQVSYASTRMLHAWAIPAEVDGEAYVDASYTCACPAREVAEHGLTTLIAIGADPSPLFRDIYSSEEITDGSVINGAKVLVIKPEEDLKALGVDYAAATEEGLDRAYALGLEAGHRFTEAHAAALNTAGSAA